MSGLIGCVSEFNPEFEDWQVYSEKLEQYFQANKISDSKIQVATLLSLVGTATYKLLRDLSYPKLPKDKSYEELNKLMTDQFSPVVSVWRERIRFYVAHQNERESVSEWYARVRNLAVNCKFGEQLTSILRDKFVCGLKGGPVQDRLCEEDEKKSLEALFQLAVQKESINAQSNRNQEINLLKLAPKYKGGYVKKHVPGRGSGNGADARRRESSVRFQRSMSSSTGEKNQNKGLFARYMACLGECLEMDPPPDIILFMPPPPVPTFMIPNLTSQNATNCFTSQVCNAAAWTSTGKMAVDRGEFIEMPRKDIEANWNVSGIDDTWLLVLVASSIGVLLLGALLAMFLLKCREMNMLGASTHCSMHVRDHRPIKNLDSRDCSSLTNGTNKFIHPVDVNFYNGTPSMQDNRMVWAAITPRGTQHFISENYPRDLIDYGESEDHYETLDNLTNQPTHSPANNSEYYGYQKDCDYEDPTPLIQSYQMNLETPDDHQYQIIGNTDMRCANLGFGTDSLRRSFPINRPRVSSPTRIEHPNLPPLNLYPQRSNNNTLKKNTLSYRNVDTGTLPKYGI